jgi:hypothetical protein
METLVLHVERTKIRRFTISIGCAMAERTPEAPDGVGKEQSSLVEFPKFASRGLTAMSSRSDQSNGRTGRMLRLSERAMVNDTAIWNVIECRSPGPSRTMVCSVTMPRTSPSMTLPFGGTGFRFNTT